MSVISFITILTIVNVSITLIGIYISFYLDRKDLLKINNKGDDD